MQAGDTMTLLSIENIVLNIAIWDNFSVSQACVSAKFNKCTNILNKKTNIIDKTYAVTGLLIR